MCKHKIHAGASRTETVSMSCGYTFEEYATPWDGNYWSEQRDLPSGSARLASTHVDYDIDPAKECSKRCRKAYPTTSSEPWVSTENGVMWQFTVTDFYEQKYTHNYHLYVSDRKGRLMTQPAGTPVYQDSVNGKAVSGVLHIALTGESNQEIFIRANKDSAPFASNKGLMFVPIGGSCNPIDRTSGGGDPGSSYIQKQCSLNNYNTIWYPKSCYIPHTQLALRYNVNGSPDGTRMTICRNTITSLYNHGAIKSNYQNSKSLEVQSGAMTAHAFLVTKDSWTISIASQSIVHPVGTTVFQHGGAVGYLRTALIGATASMSIYSAPGSSSFVSSQDLIINGTAKVTKVLASKIEGVGRHSGGQCRCAERARQGSSGKIDDSKWSYYYDPRPKHQVQVGDKLELILESGSIEGQKSYIATVLTTDGFYFTFMNPSNLCIRTLAQYLYRSNKARSATTLTQFAPPLHQSASLWSTWSQSYQPTSRGSYYSTSDPRNRNYELYPDIYPSNLLNVDSSWEAAYEEFSLQTSLYSTPTELLSIKESNSNFDRCLEVAQEYTIRRLTGNGDVLYQKDSMNPNYAEKFRKSRPVREGTDFDLFTEL